MLVLCFLLCIYHWEYPDQCSLLSLATEDYFYLPAIEIVSFDLTIPNYDSSSHHENLITVFKGFKENGFDCINTWLALDM